MSKVTAIPCVVLTLVLGGTSVGADPISIVYTIHITEQCRAGGCTAFSTSFPLTMTFDQAVTSQFDGAGEHNKFYGQPTFSDVPLVRPPVAEGAIALRQTADIAFERAPGEWRHVAQAQELFQSFTPTVEYRWNLSLFGVEDGFSQPPELSPTTFATFLGRPLAPPNSAGFFGYSYVAGDRQHSDVSSPDAISYQGYALVAGAPAPIPEPATWMLLATALAGGWRRQHRNCLRDTKLDGRNTNLPVAG
jgi:hypothetical protein